MTHPTGVSVLMSDALGYKSECNDHRRSDSIRSVSLVESSSIQLSEKAAEDVDHSISELVSGISSFKLSD